MIDEKIRSRAARQYWLISLGQAYELGASDRFVRRRLVEGDWRRVEPCVYAVDRQPITWLRRLKAAELGTAGAAVGGLAAAALHGLTDFRKGRPEIVAAPAVSARNTGAIVHRQVGVRLTTVEGIRVTTVPQTLFDVAARVDPWRLERALDDALVGRQMAVGDLEERLAFYAGSRRPGLPRMRGLIEERRAEGWVPPASELEARLYVVIGRVRGDFEVVRQAPWPWDESPAGTVDTFVPSSGLIIEGDSRRWHTRVRDFGLRS
jgi:hypothetical protein